MLPVWPFRNRSLRHRTFGRLRTVRNGKFWRARLPFQPAGRKVEVHISRAAGEGPTDAQEKLFLRLASEYPAVMETALAALHSEYERVTHAQPHLRWPKASGPRDLLHLAPLDRIWLDDGHGHRFVLSFQHDADKEHSFHVFFRNWGLESVASER